jgi:putative transcriptional regulator
MEEFGSIQIKIEDLLKKQNLSKNKLIQRAQLQRSQLNHYCSNQVSLLDKTVLARICTVLECEIGEILLFLPPGQK